ncbi:MAG: hypothetical protein IT363_06025 [Methanoregulaceae archaeon]|nr:hypothetical protein [Methanoregulaceae archaeon]
MTDRNEVGRLLRDLTTVGRDIGPIDRVPYPNDQDPHVWLKGDENRRLGQVERALRRIGLQDRRLNIQGQSLGQLARRAVDSEALGPFIQWLTRESDSPWAGNGPHLAGTATRTGLASFDDLLALASDVVDRARGVAQRNPDDRDARYVADYLPEFLGLTRQLHDIRGRLANIARARFSNEDEQIAIAAEELESFRIPAPLVEVDRRIEERMGRETFQRLMEESRSALRSSEAICALSEAISELHEDLSAVLLGYWKASEIEGRRLIVELIDRCGGVPVWDEKTGSIEILEDRQWVLERFTAGAVGWKLQKVRFPSSSKWCGLPLPQLGERYLQMSRTARNRFLHKENLRDTHELARARSLVADQPDGILPTTVRCMDEIAGARADSAVVAPEQPDRLQRLADRIEKGNAASAIPRDLAELTGPDRVRFATMIVSKLGRSWLRKRIDREWVRHLLEAEAQGGATVGPADTPRQP